MHERTDAERQDEVFAGNRAVGRVSLAVEARNGTTRRTRVHEAGSLRVRFPGPSSRELEAVVLNTAGGIAGGDRFDLDVTTGVGARLMVTSAAAEKIYRSLGADAEIGVRLDVGAAGSLAWLPQETILFDRGRVVRTIDVDVADDARLILAEAVIFGRSGMGETVDRGRLIDRWRVRRAGRLVFAETLRVDGRIAERLGEAAIARGAVALATILLLPGDDTMVQAVRSLAANFAGEVGISAWNGFAVVRLCAADGARLRRDLMIVLGALRERSLPRLWLN
jgi:urease accessory protein